MPIRRTHRAQQRFDAGPVVLTGAERRCLYSIKLGFPGQEKVRRTLFGKGLVTSLRGSKAELTAKGRNSLAQCETAEAEAPEMSGLTGREKWLAKFAANHPKGCWG